MNDVVVDASVAIRLVIEEQGGHAEARTAMDALVAQDRRPLAPEVFTFEVGNVIARAQGKPERKAARFDAARGLVELVPLGDAALARAMGIAVDGKLSFYDAAYLALAEQERATLWTEDREILKRFPKQTASTAELLRKLRVA